MKARGTWKRRSPNTPKRRRFPPNTAARSSLTAASSVPPPRRWPTANGGGARPARRFTQAENHYNQALKLAPRDSKVWNDVGYSYYLQARYPDAERALKTADAYEPNDPKTLTNLGLVLAAEGKNDEALVALTRSGGPAVGHANLGFIFAAMGKKDEACHEYKEALANSTPSECRADGARQARPERRGRRPRDRHRRATDQRASRRGDDSARDTNALAPLTLAR